MKSYYRMVALGSSFAAGPSIKPLEDRAAMRSQRNYAHVVAERLGAHLNDLTVSGATTETILSKPQRTMLGRRFAPQSDGITADADLITVTAGGNDLGYLGGMTQAAMAGWLNQHPFGRPLGWVVGRSALPAVSTVDLEEAVSGLAGIVGVARERAPGARIVLVDYLTVVGDQTIPGPSTQLSEEQLAAFRAIADRLAGAFAQASERTGADLVAVSSMSQAHAVGSPHPWVNGFHPTFSPTPFHPNAAGMRAVADAICWTLEV